MDVAEKNEKKLRRQMRTTSKILLGFLIAILIGAILLTLPAATVTGESDFLTALFTATTSVCVTGLVVVPTFSYWTLFGKIVILALIQLGGLGIVALTSFVMLLMNRKFSLRNRMMIQDAFGLSTMQGMVVFIKRVIKGTVIVEMLGAVLYMFAFIPQFGVAHGIWYSVFNAISAFCNAGIDIIGPDSLMTYADSPIVLLTSSFLIICGGLGFVVWWDVVDVLSNVRAKKIPARDIWRRFNTHTKIILMMTFALILSGMVVTFLFECKNPLTLGNMSFGKKLLNAFFQSVTLRTQRSKFDRLTADLTVNAGNRLACLSLILDPPLADPLSDLRDRYIKVFRHIKFPHFVLTDEILYLCKQIRLPAARTDIVLLVDIRQNTSTLRTPRCIRK